MPDLFYATPTDAEAALLDRLPELTREFAATAAEFDDRAELPVAHLERLYRDGFDRATLDADLGGGGIGHEVFGEIVARIATADPSLATVWLMHVGAATGLANLTRDGLGTYYAEAFLDGERFANALSEPTSGNRFLNPQQGAVRAEGGYTLSGAKRFVSGSELAKHLLVNVAIDGEPVFFGYEPDATLNIIPIWDTLGLRATRSQLLEFDGTLLRDSHRATNPPGRFNAINAGLSSISIGVAQAALDALIDHARNRVIAGRPLSHQQWVQFEVADAEIKLTAVRAAARRALRLADLGDPASFSAIDRAKYLANKVAVEIAALGVRIGGASGFLRSSPIQRHLRDAQAGQLMAYSTEVIAGQVGKLVLGVEEAEGN